MRKEPVHIRLHDHQRQGLDTLSGMLRIPMTTLIRGMIDDYLRSYGSLHQHFTVLAELLAMARQACDNGSHQQRDKLTIGGLIDTYRRKQSVREKLPDNREGISHHFCIYIMTKYGEVREIDGYIQTGVYPSGRLGELFIKMGKIGEAAAVLDQYAILFSMALQHGAPLESLCQKGIGTRFEPSGKTKNPEIPRCTSIVDYVCKYLMLKYGSKVEELQS